MRDIIQDALRQAANAAGALAADATVVESIERAAELLVASFAKGGRVFSCGNGGSFCDAMHFAEELSGRFRSERPPLSALAISDGGHITCTANDYGYEEVFARFLEAHGRSGDVLVALSTSGTSGNVVTAAVRARTLGMTVIALTGHPGTPLGRQADVEICTPAGPHADRIQELHLKVIHVLVELSERALYPALYAG